MVIYYTEENKLEQTIPRKDKIVTETQASYMAGIMDGEGTFSITKTSQGKKLKNGEKSTAVSYQVHINVYNTNLELLQWVVENIGGRLYEHKSRKGMKPHWKTKYMVFWSNREEKLGLLNTILPYLVIKKKQAEACLEFFHLWHIPNQEKRAELRERVMKLNNSSRRNLKSVTTNTPNTLENVKIESELYGDI